MANMEQKKGSAKTYKQKLTAKEKKKKKKEKEVKQ